MGWWLDASQVAGWGSEGGKPGGTENSATNISKGVCMTHTTVLTWTQACYCLYPDRGDQLDRMPYEAIVVTLPILVELKKSDPIFVVLILVWLVFGSLVDRNLTGEARGLQSHGSNLPKEEQANA